MRKFVLLILAVLLACPAAASAAMKQLYVEVSGMTSEREMECVVDFDPSDANWRPEVITVKALSDIPDEVIEAINAQKIALITADNQYTINGKTVIETGSVRPATYYAVMTSTHAINKDENTVSIYISSMFLCETIFPEDIDAPLILDEGVKLRALQFSPYVYENEPYVSKVYAKDVSFQTYAYGFIAEIGEDTLSVDIYPFNDHIYPEVKNDDPPTRFAITEDTVWTEPLLGNPIRLNTEVIVIYDEETMEALALFYYNG